mmetsp:Transcript_10739/g.23201  ORF Transcript_10739/g.23201 Transcript_10739/m.23201 type:complete len:86 (-) Transcript_10739:202-459(-)
MISSSGGLSACSVVSLKLSSKVLGQFTVRAMCFVICGYNCDSFCDPVTSDFYHCSGFDLNPVALRMLGGFTFTVAVWASDFSGRF